MLLEARRLGYVYVGPYILGFIAGIVTAKAWLRKLIQRIGLNPVHAVPTAWDYIMSNGNYVIVTLKDGAIIYGLYSSSSFASSVPEERDIFLEAFYDRDLETGEWILKDRTRGIWIAKDEIQLIELRIPEKISHPFRKTLVTDSGNV